VQVGLGGPDVAAVQAGELGDTQAGLRRQDDDRAVASPFPPGQVWRPTRSFQDSRREPRGPPPRSLTGISAQTILLMPTGERG
jgi:hypothetical protein